MAKRYTDEFCRDAVWLATTSGLPQPQLSLDVAEGRVLQYTNGFCNPRRRHSSLGGKSRVACDRMAA